MKVIAESAKDLKHEYKIQIPAQEIETHVEKSLLEYGKKVKIPGFRTGKIPMNILRQRYDDSARKDAINEAIKETVAALIKEKGLTPASKPQVNMDNYDKGSDIDITLQVEVLPEIKLEDPSKLKITKLSVTVGDKDVDEHLLKLIENQKHTTEVKSARKSKVGDTVVIDAVASHSDFDASEQGFEGFHLEIGAGRLENFETGLTGKSVGDVVDIEFTLPENFPNKPFAGKTIQYKTTLKELREPMKAELTEVAAKELGFESLEKLREEAKKQLQESIEHPVFLYSKRQILDGLAGQYSFKIPESLMKQEFDLIWDEAEHEIEHEVESGEREKPSEKEIAKLKQKYQELAERRVRLGLVLSEFAKENKITVPKEKVAQAIIQAARQHKGYEKEAFDYYMKNPEAHAQIRAPLLEDEVMHFLLDKITVKDKNVSVEEFKKELEKLSEE